MIKTHAWKRSLVERVWTQVDMMYIAQLVDYSQKEKTREIGNAR
jgi:hypothetical protein